jgi:hypothetical protein
MKTRNSSRGNSGQVLIIVALIVTMLLLSTALYVAETAKDVAVFKSEAEPVFSAYRLGTMHTIMSALSNISNGGSTDVLAANLNPIFPDITIEQGHAFSYGYQSNLTSITATTYAIPPFVDKSPTVLVISGLNGTVSFIEWVLYPDIPLDFGSNFENSEENVFVYIVTVKETLYKLTLTFGDVIK